MAALEEPEYFADLRERGYTVIENVLTPDETETALTSFKNWENSVPGLHEYHKKYNAHGIYKFHQAGHQRHAWYIRTRPTVQNVFKQLYNTDELVTSFDSCTHIPLGTKKKKSFWCHYDSKDREPSFYQVLLV